jgi:bifunctional non-homologous end joining protein LigD
MSCGKGDRAVSTLRLGRYTVELSNEDKVLFPDAEITKGDLVGYYRDVAEVILPHVRERAITMRRLPDGINGKSFYQKEVPDYFPEWIDTATLAKEGGEVTHVVANKSATLVYLANQACITPHIWLSRADKPDHPDMIVFDLDPSEHDFEAVCDAARAVRDVFEELGLAAFVKTTGSRGLHVVSPLDRRADFDTVRQFAQDVARVLAARDSKRLTIEARKNKRRGRLFLDTVRNAYAQNIAPPYAVRSREGAPVATPIEWDEVDGSENISQRYTLKNIFKRLNQKGDPWKEIRRSARSLKTPRRRLDELLEVLR